jgi:hypothetical protein
MTRPRSEIDKDVFMRPPPQSTFRIEFVMAPGEDDEITSLRAATLALDNLDADQALAAAEYLVARYKRLAGGL